MKSNTGKVRLAMKKKWKSILLINAALMVASGSASAEGLGEVMRRITGIGQDGAQLVQTLAFVAGLVFVVGGMIGFIADSKKDGNGPITKKTATIMILVGCCLGALGSVITTGSDTVWGDGAADRGRITIPQ
ncbi:DUF6750 family protein [Pseudoxanthomonas kaohsiungensis]|nr:DUF6750 family protein [Pseudoxanthomonas kaohsiungensis]KAF1702954.1 hypothetical protein CSC66_09270 [Pseudoxanthomonas kaohsiungensis]THD00531.1 hypothetical protein B1810_24465 [Panacagrimonas perspica]